MAYQNGRVPSKALYLVKTSNGRKVKLAEKPAHYFKAMIEAHSHLQIVNSMSGYRSRWAQTMLRAFPWRYSALPARLQAAVGRSTHGLGYAIDLTGWINTTAAMAKFHFHQTNPHNDPNHFEFKL